MRVEIIHQLSRLPGVDTREVEGLAAFFGHDEPYVLAAFDGGRCCGWLPIKKVRELPLGFKAVRLTRASEVHGHVDDSSARALLEHLLHHERFSLLELGGETPRGPLARAAPTLSGFRFGVQLAPGPVRAVVPLGRDLDGWFHSLGGWAAPLARRTRSLMAAGELELLTADAAEAGRELLPMYMELEARSYKLDSGTGVGGDARRAARHARLCDSGSTLFQFLLLDGLPIAGSLSMCVGDRLVQLDGACDMSFEDAAPEEVLFMLEVREAINRGCATLELCAELVPRHMRLGAVATPTAVVQLYRRFGAHHLDSMWRRFFGYETPLPMPLGPMRSDLARQLRARTHAAEALGRLDLAGVNVERIWGDQLRAALPFDARLEQERVRRAV